MIIKRIDNEIEASKCDKLLTLLIQDERKYNKSIDRDFIVKDYFKNMIVNEENILIGAFDDDLVGYIFVKYFKDQTETEKEAQIDGLYVLEDFRRKGIATLLYNKAKIICKEKGINKLSLNVIKDNTDALNLYNKLGFDVVAYQMKTKI